MAPVSCRGRIASWDFEPERSLPSKLDVWLARGREFWPRFGEPAAALDVLDHFEITEPVDWVGNAWGGHVGALFAAAHPERCRSLVTMGTPVRALGASERRRIGALVTLYRFVGPIGPLVKAVEDGLLSPQTRTTDPDAVRLVGDALRHANRRGMYTAMRSVMLARPDRTPMLSDIAASTLIITGDELPVFDPLGRPGRRGDIVPWNDSGHCWHAPPCPARGRESSRRTRGRVLAQRRWIWAHTDTLEGERAGRWSSALPVVITCGPSCSPQRAINTPERRPGRAAGIGA